MKQKLILLLLLTIGIVACNKEFEPVKTHTFQVTKADRDTVFFAKNEKTATSFTMILEGALTKTALIMWSADSLFTDQTGFGHGAGKNDPYSFTVNQFNSDKLYLKYQPVQDSITGNLTIKVQFR